MAEEFRDTYDRLPEVIRRTMTLREYSWLSDREKNNLVTQVTTPDADAEDPPP